MPKVTYTPEWKKHEKDLYSDDPQKAREAADAFAETRAFELKHSRKAREWEKSRKESILKEKPRVVKDRIKKEQEPLLNLSKKLKTAGQFDDYLKPVAGYIIIKIEKQEKTTDSGIYLAENVELSQVNTGIVASTSSGKILDNGEYVESPVQVGEKVLFKKGAGLEIKIKDDECRFMMFSDILGVFQE